MRDWKAVRAGAHWPFLLLIVGCVDLTLAPTDEVWDGAYFRTLGDFRVATIGICDQMALADWYGRNLPLVADIMGEDVKQAGSGYRWGEIADFEGVVITGNDVETEVPNRVTAWALPAAPVCLVGLVGIARDCSGGFLRLAAEDRASRRPVTRRARGAWSASPNG